MNNSSTATKVKKPSPFLNFLGSMNLAVTLLMMLSIASVIGTVLQQNQAFQDYIIKFGPFWTDVFNSLGLFHVYGAAWFILVLIFLLISTSVCVVRNTPGFMKDMKQFSEKLTANAIKHQKYNVAFSTHIAKDEHLTHSAALLKHHGYKVKTHQHTDGSVTVAGLKGAWNRLGYFFTHISIIIICFGGLLDSNFLLKYREMTGTLVPETRSVSLDEVPQTAWVGPENLSFRGTVNIPEGSKSDILFLPYENGYLVQKLPFTIVNKDFHIDYYDTGMPKNYQSELELYIPGQEEPIRKTIEVNKPLYYENYAIYQSSFGDGGTELKLKVHPLLSPIVNPLELESTVNKVEPLKTPMGKFRLELNDFRAFNMVPLSDEEQAETGRKFHNNGPTVIFKVRNEQGKAWEYENYLMANHQDGRDFFMTGVRESAAEPFRYLFIPADEKRSKERFFKLTAMLNQSTQNMNLIRSLYPQAPGMDDRTYAMQLDLTEKLLTLFRQTGFQGIENFILNNVPKEEQTKVSEYYFAQTTFALQSIYLELLRKEGIIDDLNAEITPFDKQWFEDALTAITGFSIYGPPMFVELAGFKEIQATGLQITKSPGKDIVYFGSTLLIIGVFFMFYVRQRRVWINIQPSSSGVDLNIAAKDNKNLPETKVEMEKIADQIRDFANKA
ncbi:cytochrome c biogenesis protein ResB [Thiomicrorhabdus indica]|uniref:cytochrome c biogenesis protein ResB n=1 Tax=Thiomicrorhabdus indica TaxID=2267253 RepID=UPI002AA7420B|nr:cytochrome c biogenesis protein ResB [Thiomicrorhabdus indica]